MSWKRPARVIGNRRWGARESDAGGNRWWFEAG